MDEGVKDSLLVFGGPEGDRTTVAIVWPTCPGRDEQAEANGRLMAAAPDLLAALLEAQACLLRPRGEHGVYPGTQIEHALRKAGVL